MSWSIYVTGTKEKVREAVEATTFTFNDPIETKEFAAVKALLLERIDAFILPVNPGSAWEMSHLKLECFGSASAGCGTDYKVKLEPVQIKV